MTLAVFSWIVTLLFGIGLYLVSRQVLEIAADLVSGLVGYLRRQFQPRAMRRLIAFQEQGVAQSDAKEQKSLSPGLILYGLSQLRVAWIALGVLAALIFADALLSPVALTVILVGGELYCAQVRSQHLRRLDEDAANLIVQFSSRYPISRSLIRTLTDSVSTLPGGAVRRATEKCLARLNMNQETNLAVQPLRDAGAEHSLSHVVLARFAGLLADVQDTNQEVFLDTLRLLQEEVESRMELHQQSRQSLTLVRSTTRVLQVVVVAAALAASLLPNWRFYFVENMKNWMLFVSMLGVAALGSFYVEAELRQLEAG